MATCANLASSLSFDCDTPLVSGVDAALLYLINRADIASFTEDGSNKQIVTGITIASGGKQAYKWEGVNNSVRPNFVSLSDGFYPFQFQHTVEFRIFDRTPATELQVRNMVGSDLVAIYVRKGDNIKIMGIDSGLSANDFTVDEYEEQSSIVMTLNTDVDNSGFEPYLPRTFESGGGFEADKALLEGFLTPTP